MTRHQHEIKDPWVARLRSSFNRLVICPLIGHQRVIKMDGTKLCRRH